MFRNQEFEEYEAIQREEALKKIECLVKRYGFGRSDLLSLLPVATEQNMRDSEKPPERKSDPSFGAW